MIKKKLYSERGYWRLRQSLDKEDLKKIKEVEKLCLDLKGKKDLRKDYFDIYRKSYIAVYGEFPWHFSSAPSFIRWRNTSKHKLLNYLIRKAGELRGVEFSN